MKNQSIQKYALVFLVSFATLLTAASEEKVVQIFKGGEKLHEYKVSEIDYIEVNDYVPAPGGTNVTINGGSVTITWEAIDGAVYNVYRSTDNKNFTLIAEGISENSYTDRTPPVGVSYYRVKAIVNGSESDYTASVVATVSGGTQESGVYLGITGFNQYLYTYDMCRLDENSISGFNGFVDGLTTKFGTVLYYSVDMALDAMRASELPADLSSVALITFTDGLDQGSFMKNDKYESNEEYLEALNYRILNETVSGQPIAAYSIGIRGSDVSNIEEFRQNLSKLASSPENATEVTSMAEVNAKFQEIAEQLSQSNYIQTISLKMPGVSNGTIVRFTFDNVNSADRSELYIEGRFNLRERSLEDVKYVGLTSTSGSTIKGTVEDIFVNFTFEGVHTDSNILIKSEFTDEWTYIASSSSWQINSEFDKTENSDIVTTRSSAAIMLVLDCSSSLGSQFATVQTNAKGFIKTLYEATGATGSPEDPEKPEDPGMSIYSTTPTDLSVAIWKDDKRYFLTTEQYKKANLTDATVEGLTVLSNMGNFIISPDLLQSQYVNSDMAQKYYSDLLPDKNQAQVISARYIDINNALEGIGLPKFHSSLQYITTSEYSSGYYYAIYLDSDSGGNLYSKCSRGIIRGVKALPHDTPIIWTDIIDCSLTGLVGDRRGYALSPEADLSQFDSIDGIMVSVSGKRFIIGLQDTQSGSVTKNTAMALYSDILPDFDQAQIISMKWYDINRALESFGGTKLNESSLYMTKAPYTDTENYLIYLGGYDGGSLYHGTSGLIRSVTELPEGQKMQQIK